MMKAFVQSCPFLVPRSTVTRRQEKERRPGPLRSQAGAASVGDVCVDVLSFIQNRALECWWSLGLWKTSRSKTKPGYVPQHPLIFHLWEGDSHFQPSQMPELPTHASGKVRARAQRHTAAQTHLNLGIMSAACPLGREGRAWRQGKVLSAGAGRNYAEPERRQPGSEDTAHHRKSPASLLSSRMTPGRKRFLFPHL